MKKVFIIASASISLFFFACSNSSTKSDQKASSDSSKTMDAKTDVAFNLDTNNLKSGDSFYQCSMDPEVISDKPGACQKCGMDLTEMKKI